MEKRERRKEVLRRKFHPMLFRAATMQGEGGENREGGGGMGWHIGAQWIGEERRREKKNSHPSRGRKGGGGRRRNGLA